MDDKDTYEATDKAREYILGVIQKLIENTEELIKSISRKDGFYPQVTIDVIREGLKIQKTTLLMIGSLMENYKDISERVADLEAFNRDPESSKGI